MSNQIEELIAKAVNTNGIENARVHNVYMELLDAVKIMGKQLNIAHQLLADLSTGGIEEKRIRMADAS